MRWVAVLHDSVCGAVRRLDPHDEFHRPVFIAGDNGGCLALTRGQYASSVETTPSATAAPTPSPTASESSDGANGGEIPQSVQGNWARVDDADVNSVKAEQCDNATAAPGSFITIDATSIQYFETVSVLESVEKSDAKSLLGQFSQQNGDAVYTTRIRLDSQDDGRTLITTDDEQPGPTRYLRCPA